MSRAVAGDYQGSPVVHYRSFRNTDPPGLVQVWNEAFTGRGAVRLHTASPLERHVFAKPYFDPAGLIVAEEDGRTVGFAHAGFGTCPAADTLEVASGVTCAVGVLPARQRHGIGTALLRRCEDYLRGRGAKALYAGPLRPLNPFYHGLYGGSELAGFLASDPAAEPFLLRSGYQVDRTALVFQRRLNQPLKVVDGRFAAHRVRFELHTGTGKRLGPWWQECALGTVEPLEFALEEKPTRTVGARALVWEMEGFSWRWNKTAAGIVELEVRPDLRRHGLAKYLMAQVLRYLQEQYFELAEVQIVEPNEPAVKLLRGLGFEQVDRGRSYRRQETG
jgi:ribosomal protein S18 acetylase RimI-like enzyme